MLLIEVENLEKTYEAEGVKTPALGGVSFCVEEGEFIAIMGPSGSGKSTILHILGFLDRPTAGIYRFGGKEIGDRSQEDIAHIRNRKMGFVFQTFNLLPRLSVLENVKLPLFYSDVEESRWNSLAEQAVEDVGLSHRLHHESTRLSGGEKQRAAIARALVNNPQVIFADEPTGNLDSKSGRTIMAILQRLNEEKNHTIILITHESYTAEHARRIIHIKDGMVEKDENIDHRRRSDEFVK